MITIYSKQALPRQAEVVALNDVFFNKNTAFLIDEKAADIVLKIDRSKLCDKYTIESRFDGTKLNIDKLSTGCKTALNVMYNPEKIFDISECGENALEVIYSLDEGNVFCDYPMIAFNIKKVRTVGKSGERIFTDYEELREWWANEN